MNKQQWIKYTNGIMNNHPVNGRKHDKQIDKYIDERRQQLINEINANSDNTAEIERQVECLIDMVAGDESVILGMDKFAEMNTKAPYAQLESVDITAKYYIKHVMSNHNQALKDYYRK